MIWLRKAWAWLKADWKRWLILPACVAGVAAALRWWLGRHGRLAQEKPVIGITPKEGETKKAEIHESGKTERKSIRAIADKLRERIKKARKNHDTSTSR